MSSRAFLLDEDLNPVIAEVGRGIGLDVVSVHEIGRRGLGDRQQLAFAAAEGRVLVTRNRDDFIGLTVSFYQSGEGHPGLVVVPWSLPNKEPERIAHALKRWQEQRTAGEVAYGIFFLDPQRLARGQCPSAPVSGPGARVEGDEAR